MPWLRWAADRMVRWEALRRVGRLRILRSSYLFFALVPLAAEIVIASGLDNPIHVPALDRPLIIGLPFSWVIFYFASTAFVIATTLYLWFCPPIIRNFAHFRQFKRQGHGQQPIKDGVIASIIRKPRSEGLNAYAHFLVVYVPDTNVAAALEHINDVVDITVDLERRTIPDKADPVSLDTVWTTMTAAKEAGHARQATEVHDPWR
jgi:hypothetical protein